MSNYLRRTATLGLVAGPVMFATGDLLRRIVERGADTPTQTTAAVAAHPTLWLAAGLLGVLAPIVFIPGLVAIIAAAAGPGAPLCVVGAWMLGVSQLAAIGHAVAFYAPFALYVEAETPIGALLALDRASEQYPMLILLIALFILGLAVGTTLLFIGLWRGRKVPWWSLIAAMSFLATGFTAGIAAGLLGVGCALAAYLCAARSLDAPSRRADAVLVQS